MKGNYTSELIEQARSCDSVNEFIKRIQKSAIAAEFGDEASLLDALYDWENSTPKNKARFKHTGWFGIASALWEENR